MFYSDQPVNKKKIIFVYIKTKEILAISERHEQVLRQKKMGKKLKKNRNLRLFNCDELSADLKPRFKQ